MQEKSKFIVIAIDGPAASGKSTLARMVAKKFDYYYVSSGLLYRSVAYVLVLRYGYSVDNLTTLSFEDITHYLDTKKLVYTYDSQKGAHILFEGEDITFYLKDSAIDTIVSVIAANAAARSFISSFQHAIAADHNVVVEGRDIGSVAFPQAQFKFFLTASVEVRARRWLVDQQKRGALFSLQEAIAIVTNRDNCDMNREVGRLVVPEGAIVIDNSNLEIEETFDLICRYLVT